jgi:nucleoside recognition membrane protein YjiH
MTNSQVGKELNTNKAFSPEVSSTTTSISGIFKFFVYSLIGMITFFVPIAINGKSSIILDHIVSGIISFSSNAVTVYALLVLALGAAYPFITKTWNNGAVNTILSIFKVFGLVFGSMIIFNVGPAWLFDPSMGPFLMEKLIKPVSLLVPIGGMFLALLVSYGLLEFVGVFMQPVMRPIFKTPGRSAVDAVASYVASYSIGLLVTNRIFIEGKYTIREAAIVATGFSTVSVTFMVVIANTLDLMSIWNLYFWISLIVTFTVTAITVRIWPLNKMSDEYHNGKGFPEQIVRKDRIKTAWKEAMATANNTPSLPKNIWVNLKDGFHMAMNILPTIMSVGLLGLVLATYTPVFEVLGYIFYPLTWALQMPEPLLTAKAAAISISEIFLPALLVVEAQMVTKFIVGVLSISSVLFFSGIIPCILATDVPISVPKLVAIWFIRVILTLIIITPIAFMLF